MRSHPQPHPSLIAIARPANQNKLEPFFPPVVDNTMVATWRRCPEEFFRRHCQGLVPADKQGRFNMHIHFGAMFAKATEAVRNAYIAGARQPDAVLAGVDTIVRSWGIENPQIDPFNDYHNKTLASCILALQDYFALWPLTIDDCRIANIDGRNCVEWSGMGALEGTRHPYLLDQHGNPAQIWYSGRFDAILDYFSKCWGLDDKTATRLGDTWRNGWTLRGQFTGYCWLASLYNIRINSFIIRGVAPLIGSTNLDQVMIQRPPHMIARWLEQTIHDVNRMVQQWHEFDWPRLLDNWCGRCAFLPMCSNEVPDSLLDEYVVERWDPLQLVKTAEDIEA